MFNKKIFLFVIVFIVLIISLFAISKLLNNENHLKKKEAVKSEMDTEKNIVKDNSVEENAVKQTVVANDDSIVVSDNNDSLESDYLLQELLDLLSLNEEDVVNGQKQFEDNPIYPKWEIRINSKISGLSEEKKETIKQNHLISLYVKDRLDLNYLENESVGQMDYQENLAKLFKWHQETYKETLSDEEYEQLFEVQKEETDDIIDGTINMVPEIEITNPKTSIEDVYENVSIYKIESLTSLFKKRELSAREISKKVEAGEISPVEAGEIWNDCYQNYIDGAKELLDEKEFELIFGSQMNIE